MRLIFYYALKSHRTELEPRKARFLSIPHTKSAICAKRWGGVRRLAEGLTESDDGADKRGGAHGRREVFRPSPGTPDRAVCAGGAFPRGPVARRAPRTTSRVQVRRLSGPQADRTTCEGLRREVSAPAARCPSAARCGDERRSPSQTERTVAPKGDADGQAQHSTAHQAPK